MNKKLVIKNAKKKFNDGVILNENHLLHGIGNHTDIINVFTKRGIVSRDYLEETNWHAFCYESVFWIVDNEISLKKY